MNPEVSFLRRYNAWRMGLAPWHGPGTHPDLREVCRAIDWACEQIERMQWRPIETVPRDSRRVLVACKDTFGDWRIREAWWRIPYESAPDKSCSWCYDGDKILLDASVHNGIGATHWMPLPPPPGETK